MQPMLLAKFNPSRTLTAHCLDVAQAASTELHRSPPLPDRIGIAAGMPFAPVQALGN
jgi:hypothetical protein